MRGHIYMDTKMSLGMGCGVYPTREQLKKRDPYEHYEWEFYPEKEEMSHPPKPKLWYLLVVLKKAGISLEQVGDEMGLTFLGNVIHQFKLLKPGSCNYVCFLYNYFQKVSPNDWPAKHAILEKLAKYLPKMEQTRRKAEKSFNAWWLVANSGVKQQLSLMFFYHHQCGLKNAV